MQFPGSNKLLLSDAAIMAAVEGTLNAARLAGEDYVYVTAFSREHYGYGDWAVTLTTDKPTASVVDIRSEAA